MPAHLEVSAFIRRTQACGGFAAVLKKGEEEAGTILVVLTEGGSNSRVYDRMPQHDGSRKWHCAKRQTFDNPAEFSEYLSRRGQQDADLWIVELDISNGERFIGLSPGEA